MRSVPQPLMANFAKLPTTAPADLFLLLPNSAPQMEDSRQFYYFKTSQITQWLGEEFPVLILQASSRHLLAPFSQPLPAVGAPRCPKTLHVCSFRLAPKTGSKFSFSASRFLSSNNGSMASIFFIYPIKKQLGKQHLSLH